MRAEGLIRGVGVHNADVPPAYRVEARVVIWRADHVLKAPASALFRRQDGWAAFVYEDGRARLREVKTGKRTPYEVEVLAGLEAGEHVIVHPSNDISDDSRVNRIDTR